MRVRISYAVETENVIQEVERLIEQSERRLQNQIELLGRTRDQFYEEDIDRVLKQVDITRQELARHDQTLEDCFAILQGYSRVVEQTKSGDTNEEPKSEDG